MPRKSAVPRYTLHKPSGQGRARHQGRDVYFGPYDAPTSRERYARFVAELATQSGPSQHDVGPSVLDPDLPVAELILKYLQFAQGYYGKGAAEFVSLRGALKPVNQLYGTSRVRDFGPLAFKAVRQHMIDHQQLCRNEINRRMSRIKRAFKWAVSEELISPSVFHGLQAVAGLRRGRSQAVERDPVKPVPREVVEATIPYLSPQAAAICRLQLLTGMRPAEVLQMRPMDIDMRGAVWLYTPRSHKTEYLGREKHVPLGPKAQEVLKPFLDRATDACLFSPAEAEEWRNEQRALVRRSDRKTKIYPCELRTRTRRKESRKGKKRRRPFQPSYTPDSYRRAITYGINRARDAGVDVPHWFPYQIRHTHGTEVRRQFGLEAAQVSLGHSSADVTQIYAERDMLLAIEVARKIG